MNEQCHHFRVNARTKHMRPSRRLLLPNSEFGSHGLHCQPMLGLTVEYRMCQRDCAPIKDAVLFQDPRTRAINQRMTRLLQGKRGAARLLHHVGNPAQPRILATPVTGTRRPTKLSIVGINFVWTSCPRTWTRRQPCFHIRNAAVMLTRKH